MSYFINLKVILLNCFLIFSLFLNTFSKELHYSISMQMPHSHYYEVCIEIHNPSKIDLELFLPVWTPGSYMVREYAKNVELVNAFSGVNKLKIDKTSKSSWIVTSKGFENIKISYLVYAYEVSVRTSFLDIDHGFVVPAAVFMYVKNFEKSPLTLKINPYHDWKKVSTSLTPVKDSVLLWRAENYDELVDSPIEIGNHLEYQFYFDDKLHKMAIFGESNAPSSKMINDLKLIISESKKIFGTLPYKEYLFIIHANSQSIGGLEHKNGCVLSVPRNSLSSSLYYSKIMALFAHEFFHLWNIKRIHPINLNPFDYQKENYTHNLWFSEGFTSYYEDLLLMRTKITEPETFLNNICLNINNSINNYGSKVQSLAEASFDAWIKYYRPNENSSNSTISYYRKGALIASIIDIEIIQSTNCIQSLDNLFLNLYNTYHLSKKRGFTDIELLNSFENNGLPLSQSFFQNHIYDTILPNFNSVFLKAGLKLENLMQNKSYLGATFSKQEGKTIVNQIQRNSPAYLGGLYFGDKIISINNLKLESEIEQVLSSFEVKDTLCLEIIRNDEIRILNIILEENKQVIYRLQKIRNASEEQKNVFKKWTSRDY